MSTLQKLTYTPLFNHLFNDLLEQKTLSKTELPVNVYELKDSYLLEVIAPGRNKNDFNISVDNNLLTVSCETELKDQNKNLIRKEYNFNMFKRTFSLEENMDTESISAKYNNGILYIELPLRQKVKLLSKTVEIK